MSLSDVTTIGGIQFNVTPSGGNTVSRSYVAKNVQVVRLWKGQTWETSDYVSNVVTQARKLIFIISGEDIDQVDNLGNKRAPELLSMDMEEPESYTVELAVDKDQPKTFEVVAYQPGQNGSIAEFENGARSGKTQIQCITKNKVSRNDVEWFRAYG